MPPAPASPSSFNTSPSDSYFSMKLMNLALQVATTTSVPQITREEALAASPSGVAEDCSSPYSETSKKLIKCSKYKNSILIHLKET